MAGKKQLPPVRLATEDDIPVPLKSLVESIESGNRLDELKALRVILVSHISSENVLARDLAALTGHLRSISKEIEELELADTPDDLGRAADTGDEKFNPRAV